jgi:hypothetical protein
MIEKRRSAAPFRCFALPPLRSRSALRALFIRGVSSQASRSGAYETGRPTSRTAWQRTETFRCQPPPPTTPVRLRSNKSRSLISSEPGESGSGRLASIGCLVEDKPAPGSPPAGLWQVRCADGWGTPLLGPPPRPGCRLSLLAAPRQRQSTRQRR